MKALIKKFVEAYGPSGREGAIRELILEEIADKADKVEISPLGSIHAIVNPGAGLKVMLAAHMDEIGVIVSHIDKNGFARFQSIGGLRTPTFLGHRVRFADGTVAVIGMEAGWQQKAAPKLNQFFLDFGAPSDKESPVKVGDIGSFDRSYRELGNRLVSKSMDDRIGVAILIETMRRLKKSPHELQFAFTVQEEVGIRGARTSAYRLDPDIGFAVDITATGDTPRGIKMAVGLGKGPAIKVRDSRLLSDPRLVNLMVERAEASKIPYQLEVLAFGGTDAAAIQLSRSGVPAGCLSIPCRYAHTPSEMVDLEDVENAVKLLLEILHKPIKLES